MLVAIPVSMNAEVMMTVGDDSCNMKKKSIPKIFGGAGCQWKWVGSFFGGFWRFLLTACQLLTQNQKGRVCSWHLTNADWEPWGLLTSDSADIEGLGGLMVAQTSHLSDDVRDNTEDLWLLLKLKVQSHSNKSLISWRLVWSHILQIWLYLRLHCCLVISIGLP